MESNLSQIELVGGIGSPDHLIEVGDRLYFSGRSDRDEGNSRELWISDGTAQGTKVVKDIFPGMDGTFPGSNSSIPRNLTEFDDQLYFVDL